MPWLVDAVVPVLNGLKTLPACFESLRREVPGVYIIAVDGGSTDGSWGYLKENADMAIRKYGSPVGESRAIGQDNVTSDWCIHFDCDVVFSEGWWSRIRGYMNKPNVGSVYGLPLFGHPNTPRLADYYRLWYRVRTPNPSTLCNNLVNCNAVEVVGGFRRDFAGSEDTDLKIKLEKAGYQWICDHENFIYHPRTVEEDYRHSRWWGRSVSRIYRNPVYGTGYVLINLIYTPLVALRIPRSTVIHVKHVLYYYIGYLEGLLRS